MPFVVRRLQRMDLTFFHAHSQNIKGRQRAINIDGWLVPYLGIEAPTELLIRYRHPDSGRILAEEHPFGRLQKNYRIHGRMIEGDGFLRYSAGDFMLLRFANRVVSFGLFRNEGPEMEIFRFLSSQRNVEFRRNMGVVTDALKVRDLEVLLGSFDPALFFAEEVQALETEPSSIAVKQFVRQRISKEAYRKIKTACEANGDLGERLVVQREKERLARAGRQDLADQVEHLAASVATAPYDVKSFEGIPPEPERERYIEVKATSGDGMEFEISDAEWRFADQEREKHFLCRVTQVTSSKPKFRDVRDIVGVHLAGGASRRAVSYKVKLL